VKLLAADAEALGSFGNTQAEIVKTLLDEKSRMYRVFHLHDFDSLMIIDKIHVESVSIFKPENNPPIGADGNGVTAFQLPLRGMQAKSRQIHTLNFF
jgi:hypothetical protein